MHHITDDFKSVLKVLLDICKSARSPEPPSQDENNSPQGTTTQPTCDTITTFAPKFDPSDWLRRAKEFDSHVAVQILLKQIFVAPDNWWIQFVSFYDNLLRDRYRHLENGAIPSGLKEEMWNTYMPGEMASLRDEYRAGLHRVNKDSGELQDMSPREIRKCINWIIFCLEELKGMGYDCVW